MKAEKILLTGPFKENEDLSSSAQELKNKVEGLTQAIKGFGEATDGLKAHLDKEMLPSNRIANGHYVYKLNPGETLNPSSVHMAVDRMLRKDKEVMAQAKRFAETELGAIDVWFDTSRGCVASVEFKEKPDLRLWRSKLQGHYPVKSRKTRSVVSRLEAFKLSTGVDYRRVLSIPSNTGFSCFRGEEGIVVQSTKPLTDQVQFSPIYKKNNG